ncbi:MAG: glycosyltransferase family 2 protein [Gemmatimonadales bacterium]
MTAADVSVIVPCYNTARYLRQALESVCSQSPPPGEVIVVDDGSDDASAGIAEAFGAPVRCLRRAHQGASAARNAGLDAASRECIAFLDADDLWTAGGLACRLELLCADANADCVAGLTRQFISPELPDAVRATLHCPAGTSRARVTGVMLLRRSVAERVGRFDESLRVGEGMDWVARADAAGIVSRMVERVVLRRRLHDSNTGVRDRSQRADYLRMLKYSLDRRRNAGAPPGADA